MPKRLQNRVAESRWALPVTAVYALTVCWLYGAWQWGMWLQVLCLAVSTYLMVELNNQNALIRIYSRMVSCSYMVLVMMANFLFSSASGDLFLVGLAAFYLLLFRTYQNKHAVGYTFYAYVVLGLCSLYFRQILFFVPVLWLLQLTHLQSWSLRNFCASLLGLLTPYWFIVGYAVFIHQIPQPLSHFTDVASFTPLFYGYDLLNGPQIVTLLFIVALLIVGTVHFLHSSYQDKIRTRMLFETMMVIDYCCIAFMILRPIAYGPLLRVMIVNTAPLVGHYLALTRSRLSNVTFIVLTASALVITAYNLWSASQTF